MHKLNHILKTQQTLNCQSKTEKQPDQVNAKGFIFCLVRCCGGTEPVTNQPSLSTNKKSSYFHWTETDKKYIRLLKHNAHHKMLKYLIFSCLAIGFSHSFCLPDRMDECIKAFKKSEDINKHEKQEKERKSEETDIVGKKAEIDSEEGDDNEFFDDYDDDDNDDLLSSRRLSSRHGARCTPSSRPRYRGTCLYPGNCKNIPFSYSRTCGLGGLVCCQTSSSDFTSVSSTTKSPRTTKRPSKTTNRASSFSSSKFYSPIKFPSSTSSISSSSKRWTINSPDCGSSNIANHIYNGKLANGAFPFMVALVNNRGTSFCGGVLITRKHVLTAAHCFDDHNWRRGEIDVRIGQDNIKETENYGTEADIENVKIHERYEKKKLPRLTPVHDIAIITLDREVTNPNVATICIPKTLRDVSLYNTKAYVAGWGLTTNKRKYGVTETNLRYTKIQTFNSKECSSKYGRFMGKRDYSINDDMVCGGDNTADTCSGDSGGPLMYNTRWTQYKWEVYGIVSFGPRLCATTGLPGVYTRVDKYLSWIKRNLN